MGKLLSDLRYAVRTLARRPGFALVAILTLGLGIGANTAVFSIAQAVLLRPLPFRDPERLVLVFERNPERDSLRNVVNPGNYLEWRDRNAVFEDIAAFVAYNMNLSGDAEPKRLDVGLVTSNFLGTLGVTPALGRDFSAQDGEPGAHEVAILSHGLWKRQFGAAADVLGHEVRLNGRPTTIVGVMPAGFEVPAGSELWVPMTIGEGGLERNARGRFLLTVARLKPGVSVAQAQQAMEGIAAQLAVERPEFDTGWGAFVAPLHADLVRDARPAVVVLFGAVALVLLIGCGNLGNLLLVRSLARQRELAIRRALGAGRGQLLAQLMTESLLLALAGGACGLLLAAWLLRGLLATLPPEVPALFAIRLDLGVAGFALAVSVASACFFGLAPAWQMAWPERMSALHDGAPGSGLGRGRRRLTRLVVATEVALSLVLLVGASILLRSFLRLSRVDLGFDPAQVLSLQVSLSGPRYREDGPKLRFYADAIERIAAVPGVRSAAGMSWRPLGIGSATTFTLPDRPAPAAGQEPTGEVRIVTPGLFRTLGIPLREGRDFDSRDRLGRPDVVVVNERLAREFWPGRSALGRRIRMEWGRTIEAEVVGVVGDVRLVALATAPRVSLYWPVAQVPNDFMTFLVKASVAPSAIAGPVKAELARLDAELPVAKVVPLEDVVSDALERPRTTFVIISAFGLTAVLLAALGLFGVLSYSVRQRVPELGVRLALGALPRDLAAMVLREGVGLALGGVAAGLLVAILGAGSLDRLLYETRPNDPLALLAVTLLVLVLAAVAAWLPARRASRVEPAAALRAE